MGADTASNNVALMRRFVKEVQQDGHLELVSEFVPAQGMLDHGAHPDMPSGIGGAKIMLANFHDTLKDIKIDIEHCTSDGPMVATDKVVADRLTKDFLGVTGRGQTVRFRIMDWVKIVDGRFAEHWANVGADEEVDA